jgi:AraC-like DNA-binding protein
MKPTFRKLDSPIGGSFLIKTDDIPLHNPWHYHPEIELMYFHRAVGSRFIGDNIGKINEGEMVLIGSNLPHCIQRNWQHYKLALGDNPQVKIIQFLPDFLGKDFWKSPEMHALHRFFDTAGEGLLFSPQDLGDLGLRVLGLVDLSPAARLLELLNILLTLSQTPSKPLASTAFVETYSQSHHHKLNRVYEYSVNHFMDKITISDVAKLAHLTEAAFCRFFKQHTGKTYIQYLAELRIAFACKMLTENRHTIRCIAAECGYQNLSLFNRQFKDIKKITPSAFQEKALGQEIDTTKPA